MYRGHKIKLIPNNTQATYFKKACGVSRLAYNWGLEAWSTQYKGGRKPTAFGLKKEFNHIKREQFPFVYEVTKTACEYAFINLDVAFKRFFKKLGRYPQFKKKGVGDSFHIGAQSTKVEEDKLWIPRLGWVRMTESLRFRGKLILVTVSRTADKWFASIMVEIADTSDHGESQVYSAVGVDLGINKLATLSDGTVFENPKATKKYEGAIRRLSKSLSRKKKGSKNWEKAKLRLSRCHYRIKCIRYDTIHKMTTFLARNYSDIAMEDLNVKGMVKNHKLAKAISDASFAEIKRQLSYKATRLHFIDRFFPSTKLCMDCGQVHDMPLSQRTFECECGAAPIDRDVHAAQNIVRVGCPETA